MRTICRRKTKEIRIGHVLIGADNPVAVQSMTNTKTSDITKTVLQIKELEGAGCEIIRVGIPDEASARAIKHIKKDICIPVVADIHYDHRLALLSIENGADKIRINPGNIGDETKIKKVIEAANAAGIPIRIGVNTGSIRDEIIKRNGGLNSFAVLDSIRENLTVFEKYGFENIVLSVKSSNVLLNYEANRLLSEKYDHPVHIGVTEAGSDTAGLVRSAVGLGMLLKDGIGDTIRVSLSNEPVEEVKAAYEILGCLGLRHRGVEIISCPTCARTETDLISLVREVKKRTADIRRHIKIAVMGCPVNGIGEAKEADIGIAGTKDGFVLFERGNITARVSEKEAINELMIRIRRILDDDKETV